MLKRIAAAIFALSLLASPAIALPALGSSNTTTTPVLSSTWTYNVGALTRTGQGGVPLDNLKAANSPPVVSWKITQTKGTNGYWKDATTGLIYGAAPTTIPEVNLLATPNVGLAATEIGQGYTVNDLLTLSNGAVAKVTSINGSGSTAGVNVVSLTCATFCQLPTSTVVGPVTVSSCSTAAGGSCAATVPALFLFQYATPAQTPSPSSTGAQNNLGGNATSLDNTEFTVQAVGSDGSLSNTATIKINLIVDAANISFSSVTAAGANPAVTTYLGAGSGTQGLQTFVSACANCSGSSGDMALLFSTGMQGFNPNGLSGVSPVQSGTSGAVNQWFPAIGLPVKIQFSTLNYGAAATAAGTTPDPYTNRLVIEDACRATGTPAAWTPPIGSSLPLCDGTAGSLTTFENIIFSGAGTQAGACDLSSPTSSLTYVAPEGLTIGGLPTYNATKTVQNALQYQGTCHVTTEYTQVEYPVLWDGANLVSFVGGGLGTPPQPITGTVLGINQNNQHMVFNYTFCTGATYCPSDTSTTSANASLDVEFNHTWIQGFSQNGITEGMSAFTMTDTYVVQPIQYPLTGAHIDNFQLTDGLCPTNPSFTRTYILIAGGNSSQQGFFWGNYGSPGNCSTSGTKVNGVLYAGLGFTVSKEQSSDSTVTQAVFEHITAVRQAPQFPGTNTASGYNKVVFNSNPNDGDFLTLGLGCTPYNTCTDLGTAVHVVFKNSPVGSLQVQIGASANATAANLAAALNVSIDGTTCNQVNLTGLSALIDACTTNTNATNFVWLISSHSAIPVTRQSSLASATTTMAYGTTYYMESNNNTNAPIGPGLWFSHLNTGATCSSGTNYCGQMLIDYNYADGSLSDGSANYCTQAAAAAGTFNPTYFNVTANNVFGGLQYQSSPSCFGKTVYNKFVGDSATNTAEAQLEATSDAAWRAMSPRAKCLAYAAVLTPKTAANGGQLDLGGGNAIGALNTAGNWNDGSGLAPCYDLPSGAQYSVNPWPH